MVGITSKCILWNDKQYVEMNRKFKKTVRMRFVWNNGGDQKQISDEDGLTELRCNCTTLKTTELHDL